MSGPNTHAEDAGNVERMPHVLVHTGANKDEALS
jgi:hypothetical protein